MTRALIGIRYRLKVAIWVAKEFGNIHRNLNSANIPGKRIYSGAGQGVENKVTYNVDECVQTSR